MLGTIVHPSSLRQVVYTRLLSFRILFSTLYCFLYFFDQNLSKLEYAKDVVKLNEDQGKLQVFINEFSVLARWIDLASSIVESRLGGRTSDEVPLSTIWGICGIIVTSIYRFHDSSEIGIAVLLRHMVADGRGCAKNFSV